MTKQIMVTVAVLMASSLAQAHGSIFEVWETKLTSGPSSLDLSQSHVGGTSQISYPFNLTPAMCRCNAQFSGNTTSGHMTLSSCTYQSGTGTPNSDPGCASLNKIFSYSEIGDRATIMADDATSYLNLGIWPVTFP